jgi:hypothetical protein
MAKYTVSRDELIARLREQVKFLDLSSASYDGGFEGEAIRLATTIRVLVHDTAKSHSLLGQLGLKDFLRFWDSRRSEHPPGTIQITPNLGLIAVRVSSGPDGGSYIPCLDKFEGAGVRGYVPFADWWEPTVMVDSLGGEFSRKSYVLTVANKEGGAHVDSQLDQAYANLTRENSIGWESGPEGGPLRKFETNPAFASVRQITFELSRTLKEQIPELGGAPRQDEQVPELGGMLQERRRPDYVARERRLPDYLGQQIRLAELVYELNMNPLRDLIFSHCVLHGPAILAPTGCTFQPLDVDDYGHPEGLLWEVPSEWAVGVIAAEDCVFETCKFVGVGFTGPPHVLATLRESIPGT